MPVSATPAASGTTTPTLATDTQLGSTITTPGTYVLHTSERDLVAGETAAAWVEVMTLNDGVYETAYRTTFSHAQGAKVKISPPIPVAHGIKFWVRQDGGTARAVPWRVDKLD